MIASGRTKIRASQESGGGHEYRVHGVGGVEGERSAVEHVAGPAPYRGGRLRGFRKCSERSRGHTCLVRIRQVVTRCFYHVQRRSLGAFPLGRIGPCTLPGIGGERRSAYQWQRRVQPI